MRQASQRHVEPECHWRLRQSVQLKVASDRIEPLLRHARPPIEHVRIETGQHDPAAHQSITKIDAAIGSQIDARYDDRHDRRHKARQQQSAFNPGKRRWFHAKQLKNKRGAVTAVALV